MSRPNGCECESNRTCGVCLDRAAERNMAERYMPPRRNEAEAALRAVLKAWITK